jgi:hypothetical protein
MDQQLLGVHCCVFRVDTHSAQRASVRAARIVSEHFNENNRHRIIFLDTETDDKKDTFVVFWEAPAIQDLQRDLKRERFKHTLEDLTDELLTGAIFDHLIIKELHASKSGSELLKKFLRVHLTVDDLLDRICAVGWQQLHDLERELLDEFSKILILTHHF